jgi:hypothetical protein
MHIYWYQSIAKHCIVLSVKFEDVLSIPVLRNKPFFSKIGVQMFKCSNVQIFDRIPNFFKTRRKVNHWVLNPRLGQETIQKPP